MGYFDSYMFYQCEDYFDYQDYRPIPEDFYDEQVEAAGQTLFDFLDDF